MEKYKHKIHPIKTKPSISLNNINYHTTQGSSLELIPKKLHQPTNQQIQLELLNALDEHKFIYKRKYQRKNDSQSIQQYRNQSSRKLSSSLNSSSESLLRKQQRIILVKPSSKLSEIFIQRHDNRSVDNLSIRSNKIPFGSRRKLLMPEYYQQKETEKLVKKLLSIKPSQEVSRKKQQKDYQKHVSIRNILTSQPNDMNFVTYGEEGRVFVKNRTKCDGQTRYLLENKVLTDQSQNQLRKYLKKQRMKSRLQTLNSQKTKLKTKNKKMKTLETNHHKKYSSQNCSAIKTNLYKPSQLPRIGSSIKNEVIPRKINEIELRIHKRLSTANKVQL